MKLQITLELRLPGGSRPVRAGAELVEGPALSRLAAEIVEASKEHAANERSASHFSHLSNLDPRSAAEFLESI